MNRENRALLVELGFSPAEAKVYLTLVQNTSLSASAIAAATDLSRTSVYQMLCSLADKGLVEPGTGYGSKFTVVDPDRALPALIIRERDVFQQSAIQREQLAAELANRLTPLTNAPEPAPEELIQVIRNPKVIAERFDRLQSETKRQIDIIVKAPILNPRRDNPAQGKARKRGVHVRGLYERAAVEDSAIQPYLEGWIADGEEMRVYNGELPHKLAIFDTNVVLLPLSLPGAQMRTLFIKHQQLAQSLRVMFEFFWKQAEPLASKSREKAGAGRVAPKSREKRARSTEAGFINKQTPRKQLLGANSNH